MNKVFVLQPNEDWIVDRFVKEWNEDNKDITVLHPSQADVIWLLADWCWERLAIHGFLSNKKVLTTIHHIVPEKFFGTDKELSFKLRDKFTTAYHVYNQQTYDIVSTITKKPIHLIHYWANQKVWKKTGDKLELRKKHNLPIDDYLIGSFQRDTEGSDLISPKLEKGPDILADFVEKNILIKSAKNIHVVLAGWRRQYIINRLEKSKISYTYFEKPTIQIVNELYQTLDLYPVTSRYEGGPQSLIECGLLGVNVISTPVGIASQVLPSTAINSNLCNAIPAIPVVDNWKLPTGYSKFRELLFDF